MPLWRLGQDHRGEPRVVYTFSEARQRLAPLLERARRNGEVRIKCRDSQVFVIRPERSRASPLDIEGVDLNISAKEIMEYVRESRERDGPANAEHDHKPA